MNFFNWLGRLMGAGKPTTANSVRLTARCNRCGELVEGRVNIYNDLSPVYDGDKTSFFSRKVLIGQGHCFQQIEVLLTFDANRKVTERQISGGTFVDPE